MMGAFAAALFFIIMLIAEVLLGVFLVCYAGHCFLSAMQDTAAGNDEVTWPDEPLQDWIVRGIYVVGMLLIGLAPVGIVRGILISQRVEGDFTLPELAGGAILVWLLFPIMLLSSLSGGSRLYILRTSVLGQLARVPGAVFVLYFVSGLLLAGWLALVYFTFARAWWVLPAAAIAGAAFLLLYARLLGRVAWVLNELKPIKRKAMEKIKPVPGAKAAAHDPWAAPAEKRRKKAAEAAPAKPTEAVYGFAEDPVSLPPAEVPLDGYPAIEDETFNVQDAPETPKKEGSGLISRSISRADKEEENLTLPSKPPPPPARPLLDGVYSFPWYASNRKVMVFLAIGGMVLGAIALLMKVPE